MNQKPYDNHCTNKNAIVVIAIGKSRMWDLCKPSIIQYSKKYKIPLEIITERKFSNVKYDHISYFNWFEKNQIYEFFNKYDRILRLDWDVLITPQCPNLFEIVPINKIGAVFEDKGNRKVNRRKRIRLIQEKLGNVGWTKGYINAGITLTSKKHKEIFYTTIESIENLKKVDVQNREQTFLHFMIKKHNFEVHELSFKFNHMYFFSESWNGSPYRLDSYIIHYAGSGRDKDKLTRKMEYDYKKLFIKKQTRLKKIISKLIKFNYFFYRIYSYFREWKEVFLFEDKLFQGHFRKRLRILKKRLRKINRKLAKKNYFFFLIFAYIQKLKKIFLYKDKPFQRLFRLLLKILKSKISRRM